MLNVTQLVRVPYSLPQIKQLYLQIFKFCIFRTITGAPNPAKFSSASRGSWKDSYNISWAVESLSPIEEYKLLFRRLPDNPGMSEDGHPQPLHHQSQRKSFHGRVSSPGPECITQKPRHPTL